MIEVCGKTPLHDLIWKDFLDLNNKPLLFNSYMEYFLILVEWIKKYETSLENSIYWNRLSTVLDIHINDYLSKEPEILLNKESKRMFSVKPHSVDSFVMRLSDTLWDLIKISSGKECPRCRDDELNYVVAEVKKQERKNLFWNVIHVDEL